MLEPSIGSSRLSTSQADRATQPLVDVECPQFFTVPFG